MTTTTTEQRRGRRGQYNDRGQFSVKEFENPSGEAAYRVSGYKMDGARVRENFKTHAGAVARKQELEIEAANIQTAGRTVFTRLTQEQVNEAERAYADLGDRSLLAAVRFYLENYREPDKFKSVTSAFDDFILEKADLNKYSLRNLKTRAGFLKRHLGGRMVSDIQPHHVTDLIDTLGEGRSKVTKENDRRAMSSFFSWCIGKGYTAINPAKKLVKEKRRQNGEEPHALTLAEVRKLIHEAETFKDGKLIPYVTLGLFAGIRPEELARLSWDNIDLRDGTITIGADMAKTRSRRIIELVSLTRKTAGGKETKLTPNLVEWLAPHALKKTPIKGKNWRKDFDAIKVGAGLIEQATGKSKETVLKKKKGKLVKARRYWKRGTDAGKKWVPDTMRHTAISHFFAQTSDEAKAAEWAGNSPDVIHRHYRKLTSRNDAAEFWNIRPGGKKIASLNEARAAA